MPRQADELLEMSKRMARRLEELKQFQVGVTERLTDRIAANEEYMLAAKQIAMV